MGAKILKDYPTIFAWSDTYGNDDQSEPQTKVAIAGVTAALNAVKAGVGIVSGIFSAASSIKNLLSNDDEQDNFDQIMKGIEEIQKEVNDVKVNTNEILTLLEDAPYKDQIGRKVTMLKNLWDEAESAIKTMNAYLEDFEAGEITEDYANEQIVMTVKNWGEERTIPDGTVSHEMLPAIEELLKDFSSISLGSGKPETFPEIVRKHVQSYVAFDHLGYGQRATLIRFYQFSLAPAYYLYKLYRCNVDKMKDDNPKYWQEIYDKNEQEFKEIDDLIKKDSSNMNLAYEHYRVFRPNLSTRDEVTYFKPEVLGPYNFAKWIDNHYSVNDNPRAWFPGNNYENRFETNSTKMWNEVTGTSGDNEYLQKNLGNLGAHLDYVGINSEYPDSSLYNVLKYEGQFIGSHLYKEAVPMDGDKYEFHYFHWWPRETQIISSKYRLRWTAREGETAYQIRSFDNRWNCFKIVANEFHGDYSLFVDFGMESSRKENGECENIVFYENVPTDGQIYLDNSLSVYSFGSLKTPSTKEKYYTKNTKHCFGILEHYDTTINPIYE